MRNGRTQQRKRQLGEAKVIKADNADWGVVPNAVPAIISAADCEQAQVMAKERASKRGGASHRNRRWLLTGVLYCGECGHRFWGDPRHKGRRQDRTPVITSYYACAGRRGHVKTICPTPSTLRAEHLEAWVLDQLKRVFLADQEAVDAAIERFVAMAARDAPGAVDTERVARELEQINETVTAISMSIDPANLVLLNDCLTQLRKRKETLEAELRSAERPAATFDVAGLKKWARDRLAGLQQAMAGARNDRTRDVIATYVERITIWPSEKRGEMRLHPAAGPLWKPNDRPNRRSRVNQSGRQDLNLRPRGPKPRALASLSYAPAELAPLYGPPGRTGTAEKFAERGRGGSQRGAVSGAAHGIAQPRCCPSSAPCDLRPLGRGWRGDFDDAPRCRSGSDGTPARTRLVPLAAAPGRIGLAAGAPHPSLERKLQVPPANA